MPSALFRPACLGSVALLLLLFSGHSTHVRAQTPSNATHQARVIDAQPVHEQLGIPQQVCADETELVPPSHDASAQQPIYTTARRCKTELVYEQHTVGWDVRFEYAGAVHTMRTSHDPGAWIEVPAHLRDKNAQKTTIAAAPKNAKKSEKKSVKKTDEKSTKNPSKKSSASRLENTKTFSSENALERPGVHHHQKTKSWTTSTVPGEKITLDTEKDAIIITPPELKLPQGVEIKINPRDYGY